MTAHPRRIVLDRFFAGDLGPEERLRVEAHLTSCVECEARVEGCRREQAGLLEAMPASRFAQQVVAQGRREEPIPLASRNRRALAAVTTGIFAAAAGWFFVVAVPSNPTSGIRLKGSAGEMTVWRKRGDVVEPLPDTGGLRAGDGIRIGVHVSVDVVPSGVAGWLIDANNNVARITFEPGGGGQSISAGSFIVEAPCGPMAVLVATDHTGIAAAEGLVAKGFAAAAQEPMTASLRVRQLTCEAP